MIYNKPQLLQIYSTLAMIKQSASFLPGSSPFIAITTSIRNANSSPKLSMYNEFSTFVGEDSKTDEEPFLMDSIPTIVQKSALNSNLFSLAATLNVSPRENILYDAPRPKICGHRGAPFVEPENTLDGFRAAREMGCDSVELDVFLLKCGKLVVFHGDGDDKDPGYLTSYCGLNESILQYTAEEARKLRFSGTCEEFACPREKLKNAFIPELEEVLLQAKETGLYLKIELKGPGTEIPTLQLVDRLGMINQCSFASFDYDRIATIRKLRPEYNVDGTHEVKTGCLFTEDVPNNFIEVAQAVGASEVHLRYDTCTKDRIDAIHNAGMASMAWFRGPIGMKEDYEKRFFDVGNEDESMYQTVINTRVMALCMNRPDILANMIGRSTSTYADTLEYLP